jgi:Beta-lactamase enzyme family/ORF 12 gene product N-terminal
MMPGPARSFRSRGRPWRPCRAVAALALACLAATAAGCGSASPQRPSAAPVSFPRTPVGAQASWLFGAVKHAPIPTAQVTAHFDHTFLTQVTPAKLNDVLAQAGSLRLDSITTSQPDALVFVVTASGRTKLSVRMATDPQGRISGLVLAPASTTAMPPAPSTWGGVAHDIRSVAPDVRFLVARVSGNTCQPVQAIDAGSPGPLGSAFKLYVLDALARSVAAGQVSWNQQLTVTSAVKSLPSGVLQNDPDGTRLSVQQVAAGMISNSDNTAANMLIALLGRTAVEAATRSAGMTDPALDVPFLTTRELFVLKLDDWPHLADRYLALDAAGRQALLTGTVDRVPLSSLDPSRWTAPRDVGSLEWFASPTDICHVYASLAALARQPKLAPVAHILQINSGGIGLSGSQWRSVWFKGGSEPGVLTLNYLATARTGQTYLASVLAENPSAPIAQTPVALTLLSAIKGALTLAAG